MCKSIRMQMEDLINLIIKLEKNEEITEPENDYLDLNIPIVSDISSLAEMLLIDKNGGCNWNNIESLKAAGYSVFAIEKDSFGWLIGGISTDKGVIAYG